MIEATGMAAIRGGFERILRGTRGAIGLAVGGILVVAVGAGVMLDRAGLFGAGKAGADPTNATQVALGAKVYEASCANCHGAKLEGQPAWQRRLPTGRLPAPPHDETGHTWHHPDRHLFEITKSGIQAFAPPGYETDMPAFASTLSDKEIWAVIAFLKSTWLPEIRRRQDEISRQTRIGP
ncbi:MAG: c-type cytochrome [Pseudomonadota bacterium]